jgi:hypothetical protein
MSRPLPTSRELRQPFWKQDAMYAVIESCKALIRKAGTVRDRPKTDPMHVVIDMRALACWLHDNASKIEAERNRERDLYDRQ